MIAVIADDFTGAAEIGGVGLRYGLNVVIKTVLDDTENPDLLIIATNSRSLSPEEASLEIERITGELIRLNPDFIYKKLDSVLRGNIAAELNAQMSVMGKRRAFLIAGNPNLGRIIDRGIYRINGTLLQNTSFAQDPEFPRICSSVIELIGQTPVPAVSRKISDPLPEYGIIVGDVTNQSDMSKWAGLIDKNSVPCGSAGFLDELLAKRYVKKNTPSKEIYNLGAKTVFVLGSMFPKNDRMIGKMNGFGLINMNMPVSLYNNPEIVEEDLKNWAGNIIEKLNGGHKIAVTIENINHHGPGLSNKIRKIVGRLILLVIEEVELKDLLIEGGATTYEVLKCLRIKKLIPFHELDLGIIQMKVEEYPGLCITTKPGSYSWPDRVDFEDKRHTKL
ncbi:MAG TPA: four-carbon acid sugar kinase family protein [Bacteroidaceae bacterium]|nr:four-carbon acid sugar kinase family protein [Bacteroidaceae bacterium]